MREGLAAAIAAACLFNWLSPVEVRAAEATECQARHDGQATCDEKPDREEPVIYPMEFIEGPQAVFGLRCRLEYWQAVLLNLRPLYPEFCPGALEWKIRVDRIYR